jgi:hypothetical protein
MMAKGKKSKLPKSIGGVKIPKELRKAGNAAKDFAKGPIVGELVSAALLAAAASLTDDKKKRTKDGAQSFASDVGKEASAIGQTVKRALIDAARHLLDDFDGPTQPKANVAPAATATTAKPKAKAKPKTTAKPKAKKPAANSVGKKRTI